jgi:KaiC/GvpD/RAD55 family RecA-like ATPase
MDELVEGGYPRGNLIVLSGPPGSGKTIFGFQFLYDGILRRGEVGLYVSFLETKESFFSNFEHLGFDLDDLKKTGRFNLMSFVTTMEQGMTDSIGQVINEISHRKVTILVIDSFTAIKASMAKPIEARIFLNTILGKMSRLLGSTTLLIVEKMGNERGPGMEEFVADGVINLEAVVDGLEIRRRVLIPKMRGTSHSLKYHTMVIGKNGLLITGVTKGRRGPY